VEYLRTKQLLLVLDNCEHVVGAAAELADALLRGCSRVRVLATSREPLGVAGEHVQPVAPLDAPDAVALFVQRATAASPSFGLAGQNSLDIAEICRRLDGLPLALELVAPKVRSLSARDIVARLDRFLQGVALVSGASLRARRDDPHAALVLFGQVIDHWQRAGNWTQQWITLRNVISLFARLGADESAAILCGALDCRRTAAPLFGADADRLASTSAALCARLGEHRHRDCLTRGATITDDDAVMFVANEIDRAARSRAR
jgi:hypothetical protein